MKAITVHKVIMSQKLTLLGRVENIVGKEENAGYQFSKGFFSPGLLKVEIMLLPAFSPFPTILSQGLLKVRIT